MEQDQDMVAASRYLGEHGKAGSLALRTAFLSVITLGIYRFWMKTRLRRFFWSSIAVDGEPLEYTGTGLELFFGFLVAMIVLALYLTPVNFALSYVDLALWGDNPFSGYISFLAVLPLIYFAMYRGRRYLLARTKWRGIRFGMERGGWGYAWRATLWSLAFVVTLGLARPAMDWALEKYKSDRTWFGDRKVTMEGRWGPLMRPYLAFWLSGVAVIGAMIGIGFWIASQTSEAFEGEEAGDFEALPGAGLELAIELMPLLLVIAGPLLWFLWMRYSTARFRHFAAARRLGDDICFASTLRAGPLFWMYVGGYLLVMLALGLLGTVLTLFSVPFFKSMITPETWIALNEALLATQMDPWQWGRVMLLAWPLILGVILFYGTIIAVGTALWTNFVVSRRVGLIFNTLRMSGMEALRETAQRPRDESREAGGFADAFDIDVGFGL